MQVLTPVFKHVRPYLITQPEFATGSYAFMFCSDGIDPVSRPVPSEDASEAPTSTVDSAGSNEKGLHGQQPPVLTDGVDWMGWDHKRLQTRYYNREVHRAAFALPQFFVEAVRGIDKETPSLAIEWQVHCFATGGHAYLKPV
eukprot:COSAG02_NODE_2886_length_7814_cov_3.379123_6_plen_142_part_00